MSLLAALEVVVSHSESRLRVSMLRSAQLFTQLDILGGPVHFPRSQEDRNCGELSFNEFQHRIFLEKHWRSLKRLAQVLVRVLDRESRTLALN